MDAKDIANQPWFQELRDEVRSHLERGKQEGGDRRTALEKELTERREQILGWTTSLGKRTLNATVRATLEASMEEAINRQQQIETALNADENFKGAAEKILDPQAVADRLSRLHEVLAANNPSMGNILLSQHIDRIDCFPDGRVLLRTCKLGALADANELLSDKQVTQASANKPVTPRRRARLRVDDADYEGAETAAEWATDPNRFAGLGEEWFSTVEFQIPARPPSWVAENAQKVFQRRQEAKLSHSKLATEFGVSKPTIRAAIDCYLESHPDAKDEVNLPSGGARPPKFDLASFADEARQLWENGWSKLRLAGKYGCSTPTIDKALSYAFEQAGMSVPTRKERQAVKQAEARALLDVGHSLDEIVEEMNISDVTARKYLKASFKAEGKAMPDMRTRLSRQ